MKRVTYSQEMRDRAKADKKHLVTIDVPGMTFQGPCTKAECKEAIAMITRWFKKENTDGN